VFTNEHNEQPGYLYSIEHVLRENGTYLKECAGAVMDDLITNFPVFIFHKGEVAWGENVTPEGEQAEWQINLTTAEELIRKGIIELEKAKLFVAGFKNPREFACVLAVTKSEGAHFIFYPYP
jgi:hypothetical protein